MDRGIAKGSVRHGQRVPAYGTAVWSFDNISSVTFEMTTGSCITTRITTQAFLNRDIGACAV